jgi:cysteinyl-tRNA synthetase
MGRVDVRLYNSLGREIQLFEPLEKGKVRLYTCGPTVYDYAHIGNMRTYVFEDVLRRTLEYAGYEVHHVMNITDVGHLSGDEDDGEDKMLTGARKTGKSVWDIAQAYTDAFFVDAERLNLRKPHIACKATDHIAQMIDLIKRLQDGGYAYVAKGNVFFDTSKFADYGKMALLDRQDLRVGARIEVDESKRNPADFALWFTNSKFEHQAMMWDSPWGRGYPGWHIECSAMSMKYLGDQIDIHCGGVDHIPVHHTNEIAQSEAATGRPWVNYWLHGEFLLTDKAKMAKSAGNFQTLSALMDEGFDPLDFRYLCLGAHYRSQLQYSADSMGSARSSRKSLVDRVVRLSERSEPAGEMGESAARYLAEFELHFGTDLNAPKGLAGLWNMIKDPSVPDAQKLTCAYRMDYVLGLDLDAKSETADVLEPELQKLVEARESARGSRDFERADTLRDELAAKGILIEDTPQGTRWQREK